MDKVWDEQIKWARENDRYFEGETRKCLPNLVFEGSMCFPEDGIRLFHTPGHTTGCISIYDSMDKVLHTGDSWGNEPAELQQQIAAYQQCDFEACISGHSGPHSKEKVFEWLATALTEAQK